MSLINKTKGISGIAHGLIALIAIPVLFGIFNFCPPAYSADSSYVITHEDIVAELCTYLGTDKFYSLIPYRTYEKKIIDNITAEKAIEIRIIDRNRGKALKADNFSVLLISDGKTIRRFELRNYIGIEVPVAITSTDLKKGDRIASAIEFEYVDLTGKPSRMPIYEIDTIPDSVLKLNLQAGRILDLSLLEAPDLIKRNQKVLVFIENDTISISMIGVAVESGKLGDEIRVLNETSGKTLYCVVTGDGEAEIR